VLVLTEYIYFLSFSHCGLPPKPYNTVYAQAAENSSVVQLPVAAFKEVLREHPDIYTYEDDSSNYGLDSKGYIYST
jgi:hypothetical protein